MIAIFGKMCFKLPIISIKCQFIIIMVLSLASYLSLYVYNETILSKKKLYTSYQKIPQDLLPLVEKRQVKASFPNAVSSQYWQQAGVTNDLYIYSAYYKEDENIVQIIGIVLLKTKVTCTCIFHSPDSMKQNEMDGKLELLPEDHVMPYSGVFITCPLKIASKPLTVGIKFQNVTTYLRVIYARPRRYNFTVCMSCLHGPFSDVFSIIEMVEADMIFGAEYFIVYNYSTSPEVDQVLWHYENRGLMKIIQWNLPTENVWYFGQLASIQDCTFYSRNQTKYLLIKDLDELIVPRIHKNWHDLMKELDKENSRNASYIFRNAFYRLEWGQDIEGFKDGTAAQLLGLRSLLYIWREEKISNLFYRTKSIVHPELINTAGIHFPWRMKRGYIPYHAVDPEIALLHHYRTFRGNRTRCKDAIMRTFADDLINNVNKTLAQLGYKNINRTLHDAK